MLLASSGEGGSLVSLSDLPNIVLHVLYVLSLGEGQINQAMLALVGNGMNPEYGSPHRSNNYMPSLL